MDATDTRGVYRSHRTAATAVKPRGFHRATTLDPHDRLCPRLRRHRPRIGDHLRRNDVPPGHVVGTRVPGTVRRPALTAAVRADPPSVTTRICRGACPRSRRAFPSAVAGAEVALHDRSPEVVELRRHHLAPGAAGERIDEPREPGVLTQPEEGRLCAEAMHRVEFADGDRHGAGVGRVGEMHITVGVEMCRRLTVGHDEQHGLRGGVAPEVPLSQQQRVVQVGALVPNGILRRQVLDVHHFGIPGERDQLQAVTAETTGDEVMKGQGGALHGHPSPVQLHREGRVHQKRDGGLGALLGFDHFDVACLESHTGCRVAAVGDGPEHGIRHRARNVPRLGVAERPFAGGAGAVARRTGVARLAAAGARGLACGDVPQQRTAQLPHGAGGEPQRPVGGPLQHPGVLQLLLEVAQGTGADGRIVTDEAGERVHIDVVHPGAGVGLAQLLGQRVEI